MMMWILYTCLFITAINGLMLTATLQRLDKFNARAIEIDQKLARLRRRKF